MHASSAEHRQYCAPTFFSAPSHDSGSLLRRRSHGTHLAAAYGHSLWVEHSCVNTRSAACYGQTVIAAPSRRLGHTVRALRGLKRARSIALARFWMDYECILALSLRMRSDLTPRFVAECRLLQPPDTNHLIYPEPFPTEDTGQSNRLLLRRHVRRLQDGLLPFRRPGVHIFERRGPSHGSQCRC